MEFGVNMDRTEKKWLIAALIFAVVALFINLGSDGMTAAQEGRTATITRNMLLSGNLLDMNAEHGIPYEKPIGHYWLSLPFSAAFDLAGEPLQRPVEWAMRLPSALSALVAVLVAGFLALRMYGARTAAASMVVLSTMMMFNHLGRLAHIDMPLAAAYACAMLFLYLGYLENMKSNPWIYGFYAFLGWGGLLKGPLVVILAGLVFLGLMIWRRNVRMLWEIRPLTGGVVFLAVALPWYIVETVRTDGAFFQEFIVNQNLKRFTGIGSTYRDGERMPIWYYFPKLFAGTLPWSIAAIGGILLNWKSLLKFRYRACTVFLLMWAGTAFLFFSLSALKRGDYLLPLYVPLAVLTARAIVMACEKAGALSRKWLWVWSGVSGVVLLLFVVNLTGVFVRLGNFFTTSKVKYISRNDAMNLAMYSNLINHWIVVSLLGLVLLLGILFLFGRLLEKRKAFGAFAVASCLVLAGFCLYNQVIDPGTNEVRTVKPFVRDAQKMIPANEKIAHIGDFNTELLFFLNHPYSIRLEPSIRYVVAGESAANELRAAGGWTELLVTPPKHRYPLVLFVRRNPTEEHVP